MINLFNAGTKRITVIAPEAHSIIEPHCSLHPSFRQSQHSEIVSADDYRHAVAAAVAAVENRSSSTNGKSRAAELHEETMSVEVWEVDLLPGRVLYIPAGYYHSVVTGISSPCMLGDDGLTDRSYYASILLV